MAAAAPAPAAPQPAKMAAAPRPQAHARPAPKRATPARGKAAEGAEEDPLHLPNEVPPPPRGEAEDSFDRVFGKAEAPEGDAAPEPKAKHVYIPPAPGGGTADKKKLTDEDIMQVVLAHKPAIVECVKAQHEEDPATAGRLVMRWKILPNGTARDVEVESNEFASTSLAGCVAKQIRAWRFPQSQEGQPAVSFPFTF